MDFNGLRGWLSFKFFRFFEELRSSTAAILKFREYRFWHLLRAYFEKFCKVISPENVLNQFLLISCEFCQILADIRNCNSTPRSAQIRPKRLLPLFVSCPKIKPHFRPSLETSRLNLVQKEFSWFFRTFKRVTPSSPPDFVWIPSEFFHGLCPNSYRNFSRTPSKNFTRQNHPSSPPLENLSKFIYSKIP